MSSMADVKIDHDLGLTPLSSFREGLEVACQYGVFVI